MKKSDIKIGRPRIKDSEKVLYQRIAIDYDVYLMILKYKDKLNKVTKRKYTNSSLIRAALDNMFKEI